MEAPRWGVGGALDPTQVPRNLSLLFPPTLTLPDVVVLSLSLISGGKEPRRPSSQHARFPLLLSPFNSLKVPDSYVCQSLPGAGTNKHLFCDSCLKRSLSKAQNECREESDQLWGLMAS